MELFKPLTFKEIILRLIEEMLLSIFIPCNELMRYKLIDLKLFEKFLAG